MTLDRYLSQNEIRPSVFAAKIGVSPSTITRILRGERSPGFELVMKIKGATGGEVTAEDWYKPADGEPAQ